MSLSRVAHLTLFACAAAVASGCGTPAPEPEPAPAAPAAVRGNPITGEGLPNPNPTVMAGWGQLPEGREWGSTAGVDIDPIDGNIWAYERCGAGNFGAGTPVTCETNLVDPIFKFDRETGEVLANFGAGLFVTPHGLWVDREGNVWVSDFAGNEAGTKGHQVFKFSPEGEVLLTLGTAGQPGSGPNQLNQPNDVITAPDGSIFVADGHNGQNRGTISEGSTGRILKYAPDGTFITEWGQIGALHGEFRTPHSLAFDSQGRLWVADRGNHRIEIFDQDGNYLDSRYMYGRISGLYITADDVVYAIDSESSPASHPNWMNGVRIGTVDEDWVNAFIPPFPADSRPYQGAAGEGVAVDADGNVYAAEGPNSLSWAGGGAITKYAVAGM